MMITDWHMEVLEIFIWRKKLKSTRILGKGISQAL